MPTIEQLKELQNKSLKEKIQISSARIIEWYEKWDGQVYVSFSGGKDSTVLLHLVRRLYPDVVAVFSDTGLEYPEIREFVKTIDNVDWVVPEKYNKEKKKWERYTFQNVIKDVGYPIISKNVARAIHDVKKLGENCYAYKCFNGQRTNFYDYRRYHYLINSDFNISNKCCDIMKKKPLHRYENIHKRKPFIGTMTIESKQRKNIWLQFGCNAFNSKKPQSTPIAFWTEQDILQYIKKYNLEYASVYGDLVEGKDGKLHFTGCQRTGCVFCGFGCHLEKGPNRFQRLAETHPKLYDYCINGGQYDENGIWQPGNGGLGMGHVLDYIGVNYELIKTEE